MATDLLSLYQQQEEKARLANLTRQEQATTIYKDIIERYQPGGAFGQGYEQVLQGQKTRDVGATAQRDISRGLYGIRPYEQEWEATTGAPARLKLEDIRMERLSQSQQGLASFITDIDTPYPDFGMLMQAYMAQSSAPQTVQSSGSGMSMTEKLAQARSSNWASQSLIGGGSWGGGGQTSLQSSLSAQNAAALTERKKRAAAANTPATTNEVYQPSGGTTTGGGGTSGVPVMSTESTKYVAPSSVDRTALGLSTSGMSAADALKMGMSFQDWLSVTGRSAYYKTAVEWEKAKLHHRG